MLSDLHNDVRACPEAALAWEPAAEGQCIYAGGGVRTGQAARVRLDLSEGVIVRLAADTLFTLQSVSPTEDDLAARITLTAGQVWLAVTEALGFERLEVETPTGVATVRGSFMSVAYTPESGQMAVTCLEGACELAGTAGSPVALTAGQQAEVPAAGQAPAPVQPMDSAQYAEWEQNCPETPAVPHILLSPGAAQCGQTTVPAGVVELNFGVGRWPTAEEALAAVDGSRPTISLDGQPLPVGDPTGPEWHTGGDPAGWGYSTRTRVTLEPGRYTLVSEWYWPDVFTCELTVSGR
ncbi:MAG: FecR domain-containing protein [Anaerolineales bacterium]|nr:FecR domain-containing protein [Anaerolineales bacterium]